MRNSCFHDAKQHWRFFHRLFETPSVSFPLKPLNLIPEIFQTLRFFKRRFQSQKVYSETCLIRHTLEDNFCVEILRVSDCTIDNLEEMVKWDCKLTSDKQGNKIHRCRIRQV